MIAGRKQKYDFNGLEIGEKLLLTGKAKQYPHQFARQRSQKGKKFRIIRDEKSVYAERIE